jgi:hypothetical protein
VSAVKLFAPDSGSKFSRRGRVILRIWGICATWPRADERTDRHRAPVPRPEGRLQPEVTERHVTSVADDAGSHRTGVCSTRAARCLLGRLIERQSGAEAGWTRRSTPHDRDRDEQAEGTPRQGGPAATRQRASFGFALALRQPGLARSLDNALVFPTENWVVGGS